MLNVRKTNKVLCVLSGDWHLSHDPPRARAETREEWYKVQKGYIDQVLSLGEQHQCPLVIAGDIFDRWDNPAELVNAVIDWLDGFSYMIWTIPGQHDLPNHDLSQIQRSSYWTLVQAKCVIDLPAWKSLITSNVLTLRGFPWRGHPKALDCKKQSDRLYVAVVHKYVWCQGHSHPRAKPEDYVKWLHDSLQGFDVIVCGDNHSSFLDSIGKKVFVPGTLMRRKADEIDYKPNVGLLYDNGTIEPHYLDTSKDRFRTQEVQSSPAGEDVDPEEFIQALAELGDAAFNYKEAVDRYLSKNPVTPGVREAIRAILHGDKK